MQIRLRVRRFRCGTTVVDAECSPNASRAFLLIYSRAAVCADRARRARTDRAAEVNDNGAAKVVRNGPNGTGRFSEERLERWREHPREAQVPLCSPRKGPLLVDDSGGVILLPFKQQGPFAAREYAPPFVPGFGDLQCQIRICSADGVSVERGSSYFGRRPNEQPQTIIGVELQMLRGGALDKFVDGCGLCFGRRR